MKNTKANSLKTRVQHAVGNICNQINVVDEGVNYIRVAQFADIDDCITSQFIRKLIVGEEEGQYVLNSVSVYGGVLSALVFHDGGKSQ